MLHLISIGQIIDQTFHLYEKHLVDYLRIAAWIFLSLPLMLLSMVLFPIVQDSPSGVLGVTALVAVNAIVTVLVGCFVSASLITATDSYAEEKNATYKEVLARGKARALPLFAQSLLLGLLMFGALALVAPGLGIFFVTSFRQNAGVVLPAIGMFLLFSGGAAAAILAAWFSVIFPMASYALVLEQHTIRASIRRAFALVKGRWWATMWRVMVPKLTLFVIVFFFQLLVMLFLFVASAAILPVSELIGESPAAIGVSALSRIVLTAIAVITTPAFLIADYYVFQSLAATHKTAA